MNTTSILTSITINETGSLKVYNSKITVMDQSKNYTIDCYGNIYICKSSVSYARGLYLYDGYAYFEDSIILNTFGYGLFSSKTLK